LEINYKFYRLNMRTDNTQADTYIRVHFMLKTVSPGDVTEDWRYDLTLAS